MSTRTYNRVILVVNTSKNLLLLFPLLFIKCNNFYMHIPSGNQLMLRRLMCLNKGLSIYLSISRKLNNQGQKDIAANFEDNRYQAVDKRIHCIHERDDP